MAVVAASGVVDMLTAPQLETAIRQPRSTKPTGVVIDFTDVEFLASAGMGVLVAAHDEAGSLTDFSVVADGPATSRPLKLVGIADIVPLYASLDEALAALSPEHELTRSKRRGKTRLPRTPSGKPPTAMIDSMPRLK